MPEFWRPSPPEPWWEGFGLRVARCGECVARFRSKRKSLRHRLTGVEVEVEFTARALYRSHWFAVHEAEHLDDPEWPQESVTV